MADIIPIRRKAKATAAQDCKGYVASRELLEQCAASGQMTPEQVYQHWFHGEIGKGRNDTGRRVSDDDTTLLRAELCSVCAGACATREACRIPEPAPKPARRSWLEALRALFS